MKRIASRVLTIASVFALAVACTGPEGPTGPTGPAGAPGADGEDGADGTNGTNGTNGADGSDGTNGTDGTDGVDGTDGADGAPGGTVALSETARRGLDVSPVPIDVPALVAAGMTGDDIERVAHGSYLVNTILDCVGCHSNPANPAQYLSGGLPFAAGPSTTVYSRNLTPDATTGLGLTEAEFLEVMQTGRDFDVAGGTESLIVMPWMNFRWLHVDDLKAVYAYLQEIPAVTNAVQANSGRPVIAPTPLPDTFASETEVRDLPADNNPDHDRVLRGLAINVLDTPVDFDTWSPSEQALFGRGSYLVMGGVCTDCHTPRDGTGQLRADAYLTGGTVFDVPPPLQGLLGQKRTMTANLLGFTNGMTSSFATYYGYMNSGLSRHDMPLGWPMPFMHHQNLLLWDLQAIFTYLDASRGNTAHDPETQPPARPCTVATETSDCFSGETCDATTLECVGGDCTTAADCGACQTCTGLVCTAPADLTTGCPVSGI